MHILREGASHIGLHFVACHAVYFPRGWIKSLEMVEGGPIEFSLHINGTLVAHTTDGKITRANFNADLLGDLDEKTLPNDLFLQVPNQAEYFNLSFQGRVHIVAATPPERQNYYIKQTWAQILRQKTEGTLTNTDMDFEEVPTIQAFNLRAEDQDSQIYKTTPIAISVSV